MMNTIRINDGEGLYDEVGLCTAIITILNHVEVKGSDNLHNMILAIDGVQKLQEALRKTREERNKREEVSVNDDGHPTDG